MWKKINTIDGDQQERMKVGLGKRLDLKEMMGLMKGMKEESVKQMGMQYMGVGSKAPAGSGGGKEKDEDEGKKWKDIILVGNIMIKLN